jgi:hypothetical protein
MGLDIFFADDIRRALLAADEASSSMARVCAAVGGYEASPEADVVLRAYLEGYRAALTTVALAFGLSPAIIDGDKPLEVPVLDSSALRQGSGQASLTVNSEGPSAIGYQPSAMGHPPKK